jgi:mercuric ion transport protein
MAVPDDIRTAAGEAKSAAPRADRNAGLLFVGGIVAGLAAASCCVVPFALFLAGISGAWIGDLTALEPYRLYFAGFSVACIGIGFYRVYLMPAASCAEDSYCARPKSHRITKIGLWTASAIVVIAIASPYLIAYWFLADRRSP